MSPALKRVLAHVLVGVTALLAGFGYGRHSAPTKTVTVESTAQLDALRKEIAELKQENTSLKKHTVTTTVVTFSEKTGKPLKKETKQDTHVDKTVDLRVDARLNAEATSAKLTEKTLTVESPRPINSLGALVDLNLTNGRVSYGAQYGLRLWSVRVTAHVMASPPRGAFEKTETRVGGGLHLEF
jgi:hypothetical protein